MPELLHLVIRLFFLPKAQPRQSHKHFHILPLTTNLYFAYSLTITITNHIKIK
jgi:hypothetical protein